MNGSIQFVKAQFAIDLSALTATYVVVNKTVMQVFGRQITRLERAYVTVFQVEFSAVC
jgi:hypothetical protein